MSKTLSYFMVKMELLSRLCIVKLIFYFYALITAVGCLFGKSIIYIPESGSHNAHNEILVKMKTDDKITGLDVDEQGRLYGCICNNENGAVVQINTTTGYISSD